MASRALLPSKVKMRRRKRLRALAALSGLALVLLCAGIIALARAPFLQVKVVNISGEKSLPSSMLQNLVEQHLVGNYAWVFPKNNIFLYPQREIAASLASFPAIKSASIHSQNFSTLDVVVSERIPTAEWCGDSYVASSTTNCLLLDDEGMAYAPAPQFEGDNNAVYAAYFGALPGAHTLPAQFLSGPQFQSLQALIASLVSQAQRHGSGQLRAVNVDTEQNVHAIFQSGFEIIFRLSDDAGSVADHFGLALSADPFMSHQLSAFAYLDLRFNDKLYYKLKNQ